MKKLVVGMAVGVAACGAFAAEMENWFDAQVGYYTEWPLSDEGIQPVNGSWTCLGPTYPSLAGLARITDDFHFRVAADVDEKLAFQATPPDASTVAVKFAQGQSAEIFEFASDLPDPTGARGGLAVVRETDETLAYYGIVSLGATNGWAKLDQTIESSETFSFSLETTFRGETVVYEADGDRLTLDDADVLPIVAPALPQTVAFVGAGDLQYLEGYTEARQLIAVTFAAGTGVDDILDAAGQSIAGTSVGYEGAETFVKFATSVPMPIFYVDNAKVAVTKENGVYVYTFTPTDDTTLTVTAADATSDGAATAEERKAAIIGAIDGLETAGVANVNALCAEKDAAGVRAVAAWLQNGRFTGAQLNAAVAIGVSYGLEAVSLFTTTPVAEVTTFEPATSLDDSKTAYRLVFQLKNGAEGAPTEAAATLEAKAYVEGLVKASTDVADFVTPAKAIEPDVSATYLGKTAEIAVEVSLPKTESQAFLKIGD